MIRTPTIERHKAGAAVRPKTPTAKEIEQLAASVLGTSRSGPWLARPLRSLDNRTPAEAIRTETGRRAVWRLLTAAEHGVVL